MAKKKPSKHITKPKHEKDTSDEDLNKPVFQGRCCPHAARGVNFARVRRTLKAGGSSSCADCTTDPPEEGEEEVWLCLQCGHRGCGRSSPQQHGLRHFATSHSDPHPLAVGLRSRTVWCYDCDEEVPQQSSHSLKQCVDFIMMKLKTSSKGGSSAKTLQPNKQPPNKQSLIETTLKEKSSLKVVNGEMGVRCKNVLASCKKGNTFKDISVKGLRNLGNTCYFNAVMQNLCGTHLFCHALEECCSNTYQWEIPCLKVVEDAVVEELGSTPLKVSLPKEFQLVNTFLQFLKKMSTYSQGKVAEVVNPSDLFRDLQKKSPQFQFFVQQDSHELLRQFLDGVRQDEVKRQKKAILRHFNVVNCDLDDIEDDIKKLIKAYSCYAAHTVVERVFGGLLLSTVLCEECKMSSQVFEPFMDISLPLFQEKAPRTRKPDVEENGDEFTISNKSKKDYLKPSKHQERKLKQMEKKEKKKNKKAQNKKVMHQLQESMSKEDRDAVLVEYGGKEMPETVNLETNTLEIENAGIETENSSLKNQSVDSNEKISGFNSDYVSLETKNAILSTRKESLNPGNMSLKIKNEILDFQNASLDSETKSLEKQNAILNTENVNLDSVNASLEIKKAMFDTEIEMRSCETENASLNNVSFEIENTSLEIKNTSLETENTNLETENTSLETENTSLETENLTPEPKELILKPNTFSLKTKSSFQIHRNNRLSSHNNIKRTILNGKTVEQFTQLNLNCDTVDVCGDHDIVSFEENEKPEEASSPTNKGKCEGVIVNKEAAPRAMHIRRDNASSSKECDSSPDSQQDLTNQEPAEEEGECWRGARQTTNEWLLRSLTTLRSRKHMLPKGECCSLDSCLMHFTKPELLTGNNKFRCESCSHIKQKKTGNKSEVAYSNASKQLLVFSPPAVLTLHLKRFQQVGMSLRKVNRFVEFPLILDLASYCSSASLILPHMQSSCGDVLYSLYGVVEHCGHLKGGHYTAHVKAGRAPTRCPSFLCWLPLAQCNLLQLMHKFSSQSASQKNSAVEEMHTEEEEAAWFCISDGHIRRTTEAQVLKCQAYLLFYERIK